MNKLRPSGGANPPLEAVESTACLLERARGGDRAAVDSLFARYLPPLMRWATGRLPGWARGVTDTQDLVQDVLLRTFFTLKTFEVRGEGALAAYLRQALMNRLRDELRRAKRAPAHEPLDNQVVADGPSPFEAAVGQEAVARYESALAALRPAEREAIILRLELGYSYSEIAALLDRPSPDAARMTVERGIVRLAEEMKRGG